MAYESYSLGVPVGAISICGSSDLYKNNLDFEIKDLYNWLVLCLSCWIYTLKKHISFA